MPNTPDLDITVRTHVDVEPLLKAAHAMNLMSIGMEVVQEATRASELHDNSLLVDGTGPGVGYDVVSSLARASYGGKEVSDAARERCQRASKTGDDSWERVLTEEIFEAYAEDPGSPELRGELIQCMGVIMNWIATNDIKAAAR